MSLLCNDCWKNVEPIFQRSFRKNWFHSYYCATCDSEIGRLNATTNEFVTWNGSEFVDAELSDELMAKANLLRVKR